MVADNCALKDPRDSLKAGEVNDTKVRKRKVPVCGVRMLWVASHRRQNGVGTRLLNTLTSKVFPQHLRYKLAFLQETEDGEKFCKARFDSSGYNLYTRSNYLE